MAPALLALALVPAALGAEPESPSADLVRRIEQLMSERHIPGAAVAVVEDGRLLWARGFGSSEVEQEVPVRPETRFLIGSTSKPFIAVAALQLVEAGELGLDDAASEHLPELGDAYDEITVRQLLGHTAGVRRDAKERGPTPYINHQVYGEELLELLAQSPPDSPPDTSVAYSNLGPALVALIVERIAGTSIDDYLAASVFEPVGMDATRHLLATDDPGEVAGLATGSVWTGSESRASGVESRHPTGSMVSTALDLAAFVIALETDQLLRPETREQMWKTRHLVDGSDATLGTDRSGRRYGVTLGWFVHQEEGVRLVHHGGATEGFSSQIDIYPDTGRAVIVLCNYEGGPASDLAWLLRSEESAAGAEASK